MKRYVVRNFNLKFSLRIECHCGNSYGSHGESDSCNTPCGSTFGTLREETCGGTLANSVYIIGNYLY